jgi:hypothetical protein
MIDLKTFLGLLDLRVLQTVLRHLVLTFLAPLYVLAQQV